MSHPRELRRTQEIFWDLITAPEGVRPALEEMARGGRPDAESVATIFAGDEELPAVERIDVYANMYFYRLFDCLREDYPRVEAAVGSARFHNLATDYLLRHPSRSPSLRYLGEALPAFLNSHPLNDEFPYLADLARLEWARVDAFDAPDARPLTREGLARLPQDDAGEARFTLMPGVQILRFGYDVVRLWRDLREAGGSDEEGGRTEGNAAAEAHGAHTPARGPGRVPVRRTAARVWRKGYIVWHKGIDDEEARSLELLAAGEPLGRICQRLAAGRSLTRATARVGRMLQAWLDDEILATAARAE
ncbi:MAG: putative DNA-binding domain-containing protein [Acidobacteriota bacterium]